MKYNLDISIGHNLRKNCFAFLIWNSFFYVSRLLHLSNLCVARFDTKDRCSVLQATITI